LLLAKDEKEIFVTADRRRGGGNEHQKPCRRLNVRV